MRRPVARWILIFAFLGQSLMAQTVHLVKEGESLWLIAKKTGVSVSALREANNLKSDVIWEGSKLIIPAPQSQPTTRPVPTTPQTAPRTQPNAPTPAVPPLRPLSPEIVERVAPKSQVSLTSPTPSASQRSKSGISEKGMQILHQQVTLDRAGFSPGVLDGYDGRYTRLAQTLCEAWKPSALRTDLTTLTKVAVTEDWKNYVDSSLPGSGSAPDFKALTKNPQVIRYYSAVEYYAERFHCSEGLLKKLNPRVDFAALKMGQVLVVPNVEPFRLEEYFNSQGKGVYTAGLGKSKAERMVYISADDMMLTVWENSQLIRSYPITLNGEDSPRGRRTLGTITPGPNYMRKKTGLELKPGPNSPVGIVWCPLGNGFGIHGTNNPATIGRATSSGCVRLANWDAVRFASMVRKGTAIMISQKEQSYTKDD